MLSCDCSSLLVASFLSSVCAVDVSVVDDDIDDDVLPRLSLFTNFLIAFVFLSSPLLSLLLLLLLVIDEFSSMRPRLRACCNRTTVARARVVAVWEENATIFYEFAEKRVIDIYDDDDEHA